MAKNNSNQVVEKDNVDLMLEGSDNMPSNAGGDFNPLAYRNVRLEDNDPNLISFLADQARSVRLKEHFNKEINRFELCEKTYAPIYAKNGEECICKGCDNKDTQTREIQVYPVWNHSSVGKTRDSADGTQTFAINPIQLYEAKPGRKQANWIAIKETNGDPSQYYVNGTLVPESLKENGLLFSETGDNRIFVIQKTVDKNMSDKLKATSYPTIQPIEMRDAMKKIGSKEKLVVPPSVRAVFDSYTRRDLLRFYLMNRNNCKWEMWGVEPPEDEDFIVPDSPAIKAVDASKAL